ncbi:MAG: L,D-transpeptidase [Eubacteriales bacterium]|nr:L,D-transpeptidase [Eubacteriales bacterium]
MLSSIMGSLAALCLSAALSGDLSQELQQNMMYEIRARAFHPYKEHGIYENMQIVYKAGDTKIVLDAEDVQDWVRWWPDGHWDIDDDRISEYIGSLQKEFDTWDYVKILQTTESEGVPSREVRIPPGEYGWRLNRKEEIKEISKLLRRNGTSVHNLHFSSTAAEYGNPTGDYGDSYVEIDLTRQHLWMYVEGELKVSTDIVSGMMNTDRQTPAGAYAIYYKQSPAVLKGEDYETPVTFWMPFNRGIGLHDATWQWSFGGDACYYRGSHGCINLPMDAAEQIYGLISKGFPVLCYY